MQIVNNNSSPYVIANMRLDGQPITVPANSSLYVAEADLIPDGVTKIHGLFHPNVEIKDSNIIQTSNVALNCTVWRYPLSSTAPLDNSYWTYVPINLTGDFAYYGTGNFSSAPNMSRFGVGRIGTQLWNTSGTGVTKVGTWTASTPTGAYAANTYSLTAGETIEFAVTGHTLVSRNTTSTNAGYAIVAIDGDFTLANRLPLFTAADLASSLCRAGDVGKRYINTYNAGVYADYHILLADNLTDTAHTVKFEVTGTKPAASSAARAYIGGVIGCSASDAAQAINGTRVVAHIIPVNDAHGAGGSAMLLTPEIEKAGAVFVANTASSTTVTISSVTSGTVAVGQTISGAGIPANATIASFGTFTVVAGTGTIIISAAATATATGVTITGNGQYEFLGDVHGAETGESFKLYVDGVDQTALAAGAYLSGECITIETAATVANTDATGTPVMRKRINATYNATYSRYPAVFSFKADWLVAKRCRYAYPMMLPMGEGKVGTALTINNWWNSCVLGDYIAPTAAFTTNGNAQNGKVTALKAVISSTLHDFTATAEFLDNGESMNYFQKSSPYNVFLHDRSDGYDKVYFARSTLFNLETFAVGDSYKGVIGFGIASL